MTPMYDENVEYDIDIKQPNGNENINDPEIIEEAGDDDDDEDERQQDDPNEDENVNMLDFFHINDENTNNQNVDETRTRSDENKIKKLKIKNIKNIKNVNKKNGYTKSKTGDADGDDDGDDGDDADGQHIDARYGNKKNKRKIGRLKIKKPSNKTKLSKYNAKNAQITPDDAWMNKKFKKKSKHAVSESIQMLGSTKLVSRNSFKENLDTLQEEADIANIDVNAINFDALSTDDTPKTKTKKK
eukprot:521539_1